MARARARLLLALLLALAPLAGCLTDLDPADTSHHTPNPRMSVEAWRANLSEPRFDTVESHLASIPSDDGTRLTLTVHLPAGLPEGESIPTLLQLTPYQPLTLRKSTPAGTDGPTSSWRFYVERGAAYVEADARGTGGSEGCLDFGGEADRADARAFAEWIRAQPWSNGVIVTDGVSQPGMGSIVAHTAIPNLTAALAHAPVVSYYQDEWLQGAKFEGQNNGPAYQAIELAPSLYADPQSTAAQAAPCTGRTTLDYAAHDGRWTDLWAERDLSRHTPTEETPILLTHGFIDLNVHPDHTQLYWDALPDDYPKYAIFGWWYHGWPDMEGHPAQTFQDLRHRWLDTTLFGKDNGLWNEPRVLVEDSTGTWHEGHHWPLEPSERITLHPAEDGTLANTTRAEGAVTYLDRLGTQRGSWKDASAVFRTDPLTEPRLVNGAPTLHLVASSNVPETKWVAYLLDEAPDGTWQRITHGYTDSHWPGNNSTAWHDRTPGQAYEWDLHLMPTAVVLEEGHRLTLLITSQDPRHRGLPNEPPCFTDHRNGCYNPSGIYPATTAGHAQNTVHLGPDGTHVRLAWVNPTATAKPPAP